MEEGPASTVEVGKVVDENGEKAGHVLHHMGQLLLGELLHEGLVEQCTHTLRYKLTAFGRRTLEHARSA